MTSSVPAPARGISPLRFFPRALLEAEAPLRAIMTGWAMAFLPSLLLTYAVAGLMPEAPRPEFAADGLFAILMLAVFAPLVESLIMGGVLAVLLRFLPAKVAIWVSAIGWGVAHSLVALVWGLVVWWPFLIFSTVFVVWSRRSFWRGVGMASAVHGLHNLVPAVLVGFQIG